MQIREITSYLEQLAPLGSQESYDNCGLIVGNPTTEVNAALLTLDCIEATVEEAIEKGANLIIAHHPIVFKGLKKLNGKNYVERTILKAIKNDIAIYAIHTNLDNFRFGVNFEIGNRLGLKNLKTLAPKQAELNKVAVFIPTEDTEKVANAIFNAGGGSIGNYSECAFRTDGLGSFKPLENSKPVIGELNKRALVKETKFEFLVDNNKLSACISALLEAHPYQEVAYDIIPLKNGNNYEGSGMIGELETAISTKNFLQNIKDTFGCGVIKHTKLLKSEIKSVAFCGGSGSFLLNNAKRAKADIYITADFKYHEFFDAENDIIIADIGHYESEQFTPNLLERILKKKFVNFALHLTGNNTNPIIYF